MRRVHDRFDGAGGHPVAFGDVLDDGTHAAVQGRLLGGVVLLYLGSGCRNREGRRGIGPLLDPSDGRSVLEHAAADQGRDADGHQNAGGEEAAVQEMEQVLGETRRDASEA